MVGIKYFPKDLYVQNKTLILRLDLNVPLKEKKIQDHTRITLVLPFIRELIKKGAKLIVLSHLGRPKRDDKKSLSLTPIYKYLKKEINTNVYFFTGKINSELKEKISYLKNGEIILFENIRFFEEENENNENFSKQLASLGEVYINEAFSCSHRKQASIHKITKFIGECYGGPLLKKEVSAIDLVIKNKKKPVTCIIGGSKISTKINVISNLIKNVNNIVIVGAMANNFLQFNGFNIGKSKVEKNTSKIINNIYLEAKKNNCKIIIPEDCNVAYNLDGSGVSKEMNDITRAIANRKICGTLCLILKSLKL